MCSYKDAVPDYKSKSSEKHQLKKKTKLLSDTETPHPKMQ